MVALDFSMRTVGLPYLTLWHTLMPHHPPLVVHEDNQAMIRVMQTGRNPTMRYLGRTHRISVAWLHEVFKDQNQLLVYEESNTMCADIYTKGFSDRLKWRLACDLINIIDPARIKELIKPEVKRVIIPFSLTGGGYPTLTLTIVARVIAWKLLTTRRARVIVCSSTGTCLPN